MDLIEEGYTWVVDADLQAYFDTIPHEKLMEKVERRISDGRVIEILRMWLKQEIMEECKKWVPTAGSPQGAVISPLLSNIYLHDLDVALTGAGYKMIRYADDFVILTKSQNEAKEALVLVQKWVDEHQLTLHPDKTHIGNCMVEGEGFEFLGYRFEAGTSWVRRKSIQKFRDRIRELTSRVCGISIQAVIEKLNPVLRGWSNYFKNVTKYTLGTFDSFVRRRLRAIIERQHKRKSFGAGWCNQKIPNKFFAGIGLFNMEDSQRQYLARQPRLRKRSTGEPYAIIPHVRFGGRGGESHSYPYYSSEVVFAASKDQGKDVGKSMSKLRTMKMVASYRTPNLASKNLSIVRLPLACSHRLTPVSTCFHRIRG